MSLIRTLVVSISSALLSLAADPGVLTGEIRSVTGGVIPGAAVTLRSEWTGKTIQVKTDSKARYDLRGLQSDD